MHILLIAPASVNHTHKWAHSLLEAGHKITLITQHESQFSYHANINVLKLKYTGVKGYFLNVFALKKIMRNITPDVINVHYASGYGTLAALALTRPYILSVWGSDVYEFPYRSKLHKLWIKFSLKRAQLLASTSHAMARQVATLIKNKPIEVTPFGVNIEAFSNESNPFSKSTITIGTAKKLEKRYGIDVLIKAFAKLAEDNMVTTSKPLQLRLVGSGSQEHDLKKLAQQLGVYEQIEFVGAVPPSKVTSELEKMDIVVLSSRIESFGVSAVEALAAKRPTVASNVGGLPEIIEHNKTGLLCTSEDTQSFSEAIAQLINDHELCKQLSQNGFEHVTNNFSIKATTERMLDVLSSFAKTNNNKA